MEDEKPISRACRIIGGASQMARSLGITPPSVSQWISGSRPIPAERCPAIERATGGAVTCEELRPDVDWAYLRGTRCEEKISPAAAAEVKEAA
jgi:DNA-binding transcriptional regulator YdaS (Cro superfamily)